MTQTLTYYRKGLSRMLRGLGFTGRAFSALRHVPRFMRDLRHFRALGGKVGGLYPVFADYDDQAGSAKGHYFHQDLLVASLIHQASPRRHIDVGSRIDGFVAHVASFRKIEVMDVRSLSDTGHANIAFLQADLMDPANAPHRITDSLSCLHTIEHFGLGRYGDPLDPEGHIKGFRNLLNMVKSGGLLYISFPVAAETEVQFNGQRVFAPKEIFTWIPEGTSVEMMRFDFVNRAGALVAATSIDAITPGLRSGCGIYTLRITHGSAS